jgi:drug/metabolite transporter (DMT)-like permease
VRIAIAVVAALCAAFCFALGSLVQQGAARQTHARALRFGLLVALIHDRRWLGGVTVTVLSFGLQGVALAFGPLALVQPLVATEVLFALLMVARRNRRPLRRRGIIGGLGVVSGMGIFVAVSPPAGGVGVPDLAAWAPALAAMAGVTALSAFAALRTRGMARVIWLAAATAVIYALVDADTKSSVDLLTIRGAGVLATWEPYALIAGIPHGRTARQPASAHRGSCGRECRPEETRTTVRSVEMDLYKLANGPQSSAVYSACDPDIDTRNHVKFDGAGQRLRARQRIPGACGSRRRRSRLPRRRSGRSPCRYRCCRR